MYIGKKLSRLVAAAVIGGSLIFTPNVYANAPVDTEIVEVNIALSEQKIEEGKALYEQGDYQGAIDKFTEAIELNPNSAVAYSNRSKCYEKLGDNEKVKSDKSKVLDILRQKIHEHTKLMEEGNALYEQGDYQGAINKFNEAIQKGFSDDYDYLFRGSAYANLGKYEQAINDYNKALELNSDNEYAYNERGNAYSDLGEQDKAIADYNKAIELDPNFALAYNNRGYAYARTGNYEQAISDFTKSIELNPNDAVVYNNRGLAYQKLGNNSRAQADFAKAKELGYTN